MDIQELKTLLMQGKVEIVFRKVDGSERVMLATLSPEFVISNESANSDKPKRKQPEGVTVVWDLESNSWKSFRTENLISFKFLN